MPRLVPFQPSKKLGEDYVPPQTPGGSGGGHVYEKGAVSTAQDISQSGYKTGSVGKALEDIGLGQGGEPFPKSKKELQSLLGKYKTRLGPELNLSSTQIDKLWSMIQEKQLGSQSVGGIGDYTPYGKVGKTVTKADIGEGVTVKVASGGGSKKPPGSKKTGQGTGGVIQPGPDIPFEAQQRQILRPIQDDLDILYESLDPKKNVLAKDPAVQAHILDEIVQLEDKKLREVELMGESVEQAELKQQVEGAYKRSGKRISEENLELVTQDVETKRVAQAASDAEKEAIKAANKKVEQSQRFARTGVYGFGIDEDKSLRRSREVYQRDYTNPKTGKKFKKGQPKILKGDKAIKSLESEFTRHGGKEIIKDSEGRLIATKGYGSREAGYTYHQNIGGKQVNKAFESPKYIGGKDFSTRQDVTYTKQPKKSKAEHPLITGLEPEPFARPIQESVPKTTPDAPKGPKSPKPIVPADPVVEAVMKNKTITDPGRAAEIADIIKKRGKGKFIKYGALAGTLSVVAGILEAERDR